MDTFILLVRSFLIDIFQLDIFVYFLIGFVVLSLLGLLIRLVMGIIS